VPVDERVEVRAKVVERSHRNRHSGLVRRQRGIPDAKPGGTFRISALRAVSLGRNGQASPSDSSSSPSSSRRRLRA
jgi:hypothetical protein